MILQEKIQNLLIEAGYPVKDSFRSIITTCPQCGKHKHFYIFKENGHGKCMRCDASYSAAALVALLTGSSIEEAKNSLKSPQHVDTNHFPRLSLETPEPPPRTAPQTFDLPFSFYRLTDPQAKAANDYLRNRGVSEELACKYDLRYSPNMQRVIIPAYMDGRCVGWQGRDVTGEADLPYMSPSGFLKAKVLLGYDQLDAAVDYVVLTEGPFDWLKTAILRNALCSMGKNVSREQIEIIKELPFIKKVYLALDPDAFELFGKIVAQFEPIKEVYIMQPPRGKKDFGDCTIDDVLLAFLRAERYTKIGAIWATLEPL